MTTIMIKVKNVPAELGKRNALRSQSGPMLEELMRNANAIVEAIRNCKNDQELLSMVSAFIEEAESQGKKDPKLGFLMYARNAKLLSDSLIRLKENVHEAEARAKVSELVEIHNARIRELKTLEKFIPRE